MNKSLNKNKIFILLAVLLIVLIGFSFAAPEMNSLVENLTAVSDVTFKRDDKVVYLTEDEYSFTNSDVVNGIDVNSYADKYYAKKCNS